jgi:DNA helicase-4
MRQALFQQLDEYHTGVFGKAFAAWREKFKGEQNWTRWKPKGNAVRFCASNPPPQWPGKTWWEVAGAESPVDTLMKLVNEHNALHQRERMVSHKAFFDTEEKNPLTDEQSHACICMDDSVLIVAAAGSGKTSTMVAKTGYALHERLAKPEQILLLAFNRDTANELGERVLQQLKDVPDIERVKSQTFHGFGLEVIGMATGKKPSLAPWLDAGQDSKEVASIIQVLCERDKSFEREWDLFRTVYARDVGRAGERSEPDIFREGVRGFLTANNEVVKSKEERQIADWLFYYGVNYKYEATYEHDTATETHRQYRPDFFYPDIGLYHEHFALDENGRAPAHFGGDYVGGVKWKRQLHAEKGTHLFETKSFEIYTGDALRNLEGELVRRGVKLQFDPDRAPGGLPPALPADLARTFRVFQQHVKNNGLGSLQLRLALAEQSKSGNAPRLALFLSIYEKISAEWERRLGEGGFIDFEDMLIQAADLAESKRYRSPFVVVLADEFQDSSRARIRLLKALATNRDTPAHLCVVGDDWQGINRFAGSDISVMTEFEQVFEHSTRLTLNTTFRCPQYLCDVSSKFIQANPVQIKKSVMTTNKLSKTPMQAFGFDSVEAIPDFLGQQLSEMAGYVREGKLVPLKGKRVSVMLLGRYHSDKPAALDVWASQFRDVLDIAFKTVHGSKGLEAEYVFVLNVIEGTKGFPSQTQDDPALQMAMPAPDPYSFAEERRLFYVAMTRARKQVRFYTVNGRPSQFLVELMKSGELTIKAVEGEGGEPCPKCARGTLVLRSGAYGQFHSCSRITQCDYKKSLGRTGSTKAPTATRNTKVKAASGEQCPVCRRGVMTPKQGQYGMFLGCSEYPRCRTTSPMN